MCRQVGEDHQPGRKVATGYGTSIDLVVQGNNGDIFYEIKTANTALRCIREAFGQIVEYNCFVDKSNAHKMVVVDPHRADQQMMSYMMYLRKSFNLAIYYQFFFID